MIGALVIGVPLYLLDLLAPGFSWYTVGSMSIWTFALGSLAMGERSIHLATRLLVAAAPGKEISLLRYDITAVRAYGDLINTFLKAVKPVAGPIKEIQLEYFEYNPILFEGCKLRQDGTIDFESIKGNIDRIYDENRIQEICSVFSALLSMLLEFFSTIISPKYSEEVLAKSYKAIREVYGDSPLFFDILRSLPKGVLEEERIALLPRDELEARVRERTRELEESRSYTDNIIKSMMSMLIVVDLDGNIRTINKATEKVLGYDEKELIGQSVGVVFAEESLGIDDLIKKRYVRNLDKNYLAKDSRKIPILFSGSVMHDVDDKIQGAVYLAQDITDLKQVEEESCKIHVSLVEAHKKLQQAYEGEKQLRDKLIQSEKLASLGQMSAKIAHEINNPLTIISGRAQLSKRMDLDEKIEENIDIIISECNRIKNITLTFMNLSRPTLPKKEEINLNNILEQSLKILVTTGEIKHYDIQEDYISDMPIIIGDKNRLIQVFQNLLVNASHAMQKSKIKKLTLQTSISDDKKYIKVIIQDTGFGIEKEKIKKIFEIYYTTKPEGMGTGLGLVVAKDIIEKQHNGTIEVESEVDKGTTFKIKLPIKKTKANKKILVVENEAFTRELLTCYFEEKGLDAFEAQNGEEALQNFEKIQPDIILSDIRMPVMDGFELIEKIISQKPDQKIILMTGFIYEKHIREKLEKCDIPYFTKPTNLEDIWELISKKLKD